MEDVISVIVFLLVVFAVVLFGFMGELLRLARMTPAERKKDRERRQEERKQLVEQWNSEWKQERREQQVKQWKQRQVSQDGGEAMLTIGIVLILLGAIGLWVSLNMDVTVAVTTPTSLDSSSLGVSMPSRVNNIGLMDSRRNWITISGIVFLSGIILCGCGIVSKQSRKQRDWR